VNFWGETLYDLIGGYQCFGQVYCLNIQGRTYSIDGGTMFSEMFVSTERRFSHRQNITVFIFVEKVIKYWTGIK
jgi:hypothetical protein